eukprot:m.4691 g.4691  ORF g.4691 m.4691 type:complete len:102 (-) comp3318_c0_seq2:8-313(-)
MWWWASRSRWACSLTEPTNQPLALMHGIALLVLKYCYVCTAHPSMIQLRLRMNTAEMMAGDSDYYSLTESVIVSLNVRHSDAVCDFCDCQMLAAADCRNTA